MTLLRGWFGIALWQRVLAGLVLGVALGLLVPAAAPWIAFLGEIFVRLIRMLVVPIVLVTVAAGVASLADPRRLGSIGGRAVLLFVATTVIAVSVGIAVGLLLQPGAHASLGGAAPHALGPARTVYEQLVGIVPLNLFDALAKGDMLAILFAAILVGAGTVAAGEAGAPFAALLSSASAVLLHIVRFAMEFTPFGVLALVANAVAANGLAVFGSIGTLALCVVLGSLVQMLLVHSLLVGLVARVPVHRFFRGIVDALVVAFSTASSSATLPVAMRVAQDNLGIARPVASVVLPLGASIGKDGTAMYVGLLSVFGLQVFGVPLQVDTLGIVLLTAVLAAFGTAPIPSASLFMLAAVLAAAGVAPEQTALIVGFILPFDRLLDMTRTVPSASANLAVAAVVARWEGAIEPPAHSPEL
ncbi:dicarboxylate/amino acid:cation symporter [Sphingomonas sp.]|uniref:dicarboxylate/amino acid:cation symporter n=1 Tax=Sphingomonas sp. TaxID=28214 RepID=UPI001B04C897|nr:dicarboxylate/amino acid:cation symporter [Sphingomonas sp.]MBO9713317.1 dicarboxylate/amino acid:cation symporter [Sphingomonas sp.]